MPLRRSPTWGFYVAAIAPTLLAIDMVYENTVLSWDSGPQMIGFSLLHTVGVVLFPAILASIAWCVGTVLIPLFSKRWNLGNLGGVAVIAALLGVASLPYGLWVSIFAKRIAAGPHSVEFLVHMAALGEQSAVRSLLDAGVPVNASNRQGYRAIEAATTANQPEVRAYLESRGGNEKRF